MRIKRPTEQSVTVYDSSKVYGGYTLFSPHFTQDVWLIDMEGHIVHRWEMPYPLGSDVRLLPNGNQLRIHKTFTEPTAFFGTGGRQLVEVDWNGNVVWQYEDPYMHHDFARLENGNTLINRYVLLPKEVAAKVKGGIPETELEDGIWGAAFQEITPDDKIVWEWLGYEHMNPEIDIHCPLERRTIWGYVNGLDVFPNGDIVASFRYLNNIMIIDKNTGEIKWRWGTWELGHQHNPTVLGNGNILVFDNGFHRRAQDELSPTHRTEVYSRVIEANPKTDEIVWEYKAEHLPDFHSHICSSAERLPNGNTLICESSKGRIFEVTREGKVVWEFINPIYDYKPTLGLSNLVFRAHRYGYDYPGLKGRDLNPDRFEWTLREKGKAKGEEPSVSKVDETLRRRLGHLGY